MRTETDHTEDQREWTPFGSPIRKENHQPDEWQKVPDAPGVEYNWKTGKTRTNIPLPFARMEDVAMMQRDTLRFEVSRTAGVYEEIALGYTVSAVFPNSYIIGIINEWGT